MMHATSSQGERVRCQPGDRKGTVMNTIQDMNNVASWYFSKGDYANASALLDEACLMDRDFSCDQQWETQPSDSSLQRVATLQPDVTNSAPTQALSHQNHLDYFDEGFHCFQNTEVILVADTYEIAIATLWYNAGQAKRRLSNAVGAMRCFKRAVAILQYDAFYETQAARILIPTLINLGKLWYRDAQLDKAVSCLEVARSHAQILLGERHLTMGVTLNCLGVLYFHQSLPSNDLLVKSSMDCLYQAYQIVSTVLGAKHVHVATILNNLGRVLMQRDQHAEALQCYRKSLVIRRQELGANSLDYGATAYNIGQCLYKMGELDEAMIMYQDFLEIARKRITGCNRRDISVVLGGMAQICEDRKELDRALDLYEEALTIGRDAMGDVHAELASLWNRIGNLHYRRRDMDAALKCYQAGLAIDTELLSDDTHPNVAITLSNIGEVYRQNRNYNEALRVYNEVLMYQRRRHGYTQPHEDIAGTLSSIGLIYDQKGELRTAQKFLEKALRMKITLLGDKHLDVSTALMHLGSVLYKRNRAIKAMVAFKSALQIRRDSLGSNHRDVAFSLYNLGLCYMIQARHDEAIECFHETLRIERLVLGNQHQDVAMTRYKLGQAYYAHGDMSSALSNLQEALRIGQDLDDEIFEPVTVARTLNQIGSIHLVRGDTTAMMDALNEAARILRREGYNPHNVQVTTLSYSIGDEEDSPFVVTAPAA